MTWPERAKGLLARLDLRHDAGGLAGVAAALKEAYDEGYNDGHEAGAESMTERDHPDPPEYDLD